QDMSNKVWLYIILGIIILAGGIFGILYYNTGIVVSVSPEEATISANDTQLVSNQKTKLSSGKYLLQVDASGYIPYKKNINVGFGSSKNYTVNLRPLPEVQRAISNTARYAVLALDKIGMYILSDSGKTMYEILDIFSE